MGQRTTASKRLVNARDELDERDDLAKVTWLRR